MGNGGLSQLVGRVRRTRLSADGLARSASTPYLLCVARSASTPYLLRMARSASTPYLFPYHFGRRVI